VILGMPVQDTLKKCDTSGTIIETMSRNNVWYAQTPQVFRYHVLQNALAHKKIVFTDEASAVERLGLSVKIVPGSVTNLKITYPEDLILAESLIKRGVVCE
jgi:2-C-methyl-D-erythritol 4-phosphate cytidylyltransferase